MKLTVYLSISITLGFIITFTSGERPDPSCLQCICEASSNCDTENLKCPSGSSGDSYCGPYQISRYYWEHGNAIGYDFETCTNLKACAERVIINYMKKYSRDCNGDGIIDCLDYAAIHRMGADQCSDQSFYQSDYWQAFTQTQCVLNPSLEPARSPPFYSQYHHQQHQQQDKRSPQSYDLQSNLYVPKSYPPKVDSAHNGVATKPTTRSSRPISSSLPPSRSITTSTNQRRVKKKNKKHRASGQNPKRRTNQSGTYPINANYPVFRDTSDVPSARSSENNPPERRVIIEETPGAESGYGNSRSPDIPSYYVPSTNGPTLVSIPSSTPINEPRYDERPVSAPRVQQPPRQRPRTSTRPSPLNPSYIPSYPPALPPVVSSANPSPFSTPPSPFTDHPISSVHSEEFPILTPSQPPTYSPIYQPSYQPSYPPSSEHYPSYPSIEPLPPSPHSPSPYTTISTPSTQPATIPARRKRVRPSNRSRPTTTNQPSIPVQPVTVKPPIYEIHPTFPSSPPTTTTVVYYQPETVRPTTPRPLSSSLPGRRTRNGRRQPTDQPTTAVIDHFINNRPRTSVPSTEYPINSFPGTSATRINEPTERNIPSTTRINNVNIPVTSDEASEGAIISSPSSIPPLPTLGFRSDFDESSTNGDSILPSNPRPPHLTNATITVTDQCLSCLCASTESCSNKGICSNPEGPCGPYQVTYAQWVVAGKPKGNFQKCASSLDCSRGILRRYLTKHAVDCNLDSDVNCVDFALIHKYGLDNCKAIPEDLFKTGYWLNFENCYGFDRRR